MATLDGSGREVSLGMGITLRAPGLRGQASAHDITPGSTTRAPDVDGSSDALAKALADEGFLRLRAIELAVAQVPSATTTGLRSPYSDQPGLEVNVPDLGKDVAQVLLAVDENGVTTWNFPVDSGDKAAPTTRGSGGSIRFVVPAFATAPAGSSGTPPTRGVFGFLGKKVLELIALPLGRLIVPPLAGAAARAWETRSRPTRARLFDPENYLTADVPDLTEGDWQRLASGRSLWFVHGTFVTSHTAFAGLPRDVFARLYDRYEGRVAALDHHTLGYTPVENVAILKESMPAGLELPVDLISHSRGGLVARALAGQAGTDTPFDVRRLIHVATPNHGTALATPDNLVAFLDRVTTMVNLIPDGLLDVVSTTLTGVLLAVKVIATYGVTSSPGLGAMNGQGEFLANFNASPVDAEQYAIAADFTPSQGLLALTGKGLQNMMVDRVFQGASNDLVVPTAGVYEADGDSDGLAIPPERRMVLPTTRAVYHGLFFSQPDVATAIEGWLSD